MPAIQFVNLTDWSITVTTTNGPPILQDLKPRKSKNVKKKNTSKDGLKLVSVSKNGQPANVRITRSDLAKYARVVFKSEEVAGEKFLRVEGTHATKLARYFGRLVGKTFRKELIAREEKVQTPTVLEEAPDSPKSETASDSSYDLFKDDFGDEGEIIWDEEDGGGETSNGVIWNEYLAQGKYTDSMVFDNNSFVVRNHTVRDAYAGIKNSDIFNDAPDNLDNNSEELESGDGENNRVIWDDDDDWNSDKFYDAPDHPNNI